MSYQDLSIHQKISLKGIISSKKERECLGVFSCNYFDGLYMLAIINRSYIESINMFLEA